MRLGVSCALAVILILAATPIVSIWDLGTQNAEAVPLVNPGEPLVITRSYNIDRYEEWGEVTVLSTGSLRIGPGGYLVADSLFLEGNAVLIVRSGVIEITPTSYRETVGINGRCSWFELSSGSRVVIQGTDGGYDIPTSRGTSSGINVVSSRTVLLVGSSVDIKAGDGFSSPETLTGSDLLGAAFAGGSAGFKIVNENQYDIMLVTDMRIEVHAGDGGKAPDGVPPPGTGTGASKGLGGGYTRGGSVGGRVGSGGNATVVLFSSTISMSNAIINVSGGRGGDAGDGADTGNGSYAGGGGGGYTGGDGASGFNPIDPAGKGGSVSGEAGRGGSIDLLIESNILEMVGSHIVMDGGRGGSAGDGGGPQGDGGGGGGGYSGGGGGGRRYMPGGAGGNVSGSVGRGGDVDAQMLGSGSIRLESCRVLALAGEGGHAGNGGDAGPVAGGGGGGYSGGGGGSVGDVLGTEPGLAGGPSGVVKDLVGTGGQASFTFKTPRLITTASMYNVIGGSGGYIGTGGESTSTLEGHAICGGGGGGYAAGGGGGAGNGGQDFGPGGNARAVLGDVGDGGNAKLDIQCERPSIHRNTMVYVKGGEWGSTGTPIFEHPQGGGMARAATRGSLWEHIPMSEPMLWSPTHRGDVPNPPRLEWMPVLRSTTNGDLDHYLVTLAMDTAFSKNVTYWEVDRPELYIPDMGMGTYSWKVVAVYHGPPSAFGPEPLARSFRYWNEPPRLDLAHTLSIPERQIYSIYLGAYIEDPDTHPDFITIEMDHHGVQDINGLFVLFEYTTWEPDHAIAYTLSDGISKVRGFINIRVIDFNDSPEILSIGGRKPPVVVTVAENEVLMLDVEVRDPEDDPLSFKVTSQWNWVDISQTGMLVLSPGPSNLGTWNVLVTVSDDKGGVGRMHVRINVVNANDPPGPMEVFGPQNGSRYREGRPIAFTVGVSDPDIIHDQVLIVTWESDRTGMIGSTSTRGLGTFTTDLLPPGDHLITITVDDGEYTRKAWLRLTVVEGEGPSTPPSSSDLWLYMLFVAIFAVMISIGFVAGSRRMGDKGDEGGITW